MENSREEKYISKEIFKINNHPFFEGEDHQIIITPLSISSDSIEGSISISVNSLKHGFYKKDDSVVSSERILNYSHSLEPKKRDSNGNFIIKLYEYGKYPLSFYEFKIRELINLYSNNKNNDNKLEIKIIFRSNIKEIENGKGFLTRENFHIVFFNKEFDENYTKQADSLLEKSKNLTARMIKMIEEEDSNQDSSLSLKFMQSS